MFSFVRRPGFELGWSLLQIKDGDFTNHPDAMSAFDAFFANNVDYFFNVTCCSKNVQRLYHVEFQELFELTRV